MTEVALIFKVKSKSNSTHFEKDIPVKSSFLMTRITIYTEPLAYRKHNTVMITRIKVFSSVFTRMYEKKRTNVQFIQLFITFLVIYV